MQNHAICCDNVTVHSAPATERGSRFICDRFAFSGRINFAFADGERAGTREREASLLGKTGFVGERAYSVMSRESQARASDNIDLEAELSVVRDTWGTNIAAGTKNAKMKERCEECESRRERYRRLFLIASSVAFRRRMFIASPRAIPEDVSKWRRIHRSDA